MKFSINALLSTVIPLLAVIMGGTRAHPQIPVDAALSEALQVKLDSCVTAFQVPGISVALRLSGDRFWYGASGEADINTGDPMDTLFLFQQASVTKLFTATMIFQLIDEGQLALNDPISLYLPEMANISPDMPIRYLLNHRSGLADLLEDQNAPTYWFTHPDSIFDQQDVIDSFSSEPYFSPNAAFAYSNTNYVLLGMVIEAITGNSLAAELHDRITVPLGLQHTFLPPEDEFSEALVPGWTSFSQLNVYDTDVTPVLTDCFASMVSAAGAVVARPSDIAKFTRALFSGELVSATSMNTMLTFTNINFSDGCTGYGHGVMRYPLAGELFYGHGGDISGFTQLSVHQITDSITLTVSINRNNAPRVPIANALMELIYGWSGVGLEETSVSTFSVYPVPASDQVHVIIDGGGIPKQVELVDALGRSIRSVTPSTSAIILPVEDLAAGTYHVRLSIGSQVITRKLIVQH